VIYEKQNIVKVYSVSIYLKGGIMRNLKNSNLSLKMFKLSFVFLTVFIFSFNPLYAVQTDKAKDDTIYVRIGMSASFSGSRRSPSTNGLFGVLAAIDWINSDENSEFKIDDKRVKIDLIIRDDRSSNDEVERIYNDFTKRGREVDFLIGLYSSSATGVAMEIAEKSRKLILGPFGADDSIYEEASNWKVQVVPPASKYYAKHLEMLSERAVSSGQVFKVALAFETDSFSESVHSAAKKLIEDNDNFLIFFDSFYPKQGGDLLKEGGDMDLFIDGLLSSINNNTNEIDSVVIIGGGHDPDGIAFAQLLAKKDYRPDALALLIAPGIPSYFCDVAGGGDNCESSYAEGVTTVSSWQPELETFIEGETDVIDGLTWFGPSHNEAITLIKRKNGDVVPSYHAGLGGQAILALAVAIKKAQSIKSAKVRDALKDARFQTTFGNFGVDKSTGKQQLQDMLVEQWHVSSEVASLHVIWPVAQATNDFIFPIPE